MVKSRQFALIYRVTAFTIATAGFLAMLGITVDTFAPEIMMFYTMQSNLMGIVLFGILIFKTSRDLYKNQSGHSGYYPRLEMVVSVILFLTFFVYWTLLAPQMFTMETDFNMWSFGNLATHAFTPLLLLLDYVLFSPPRNLKYRDVYYVLIYPFLYILFTSIAGLLGYVYFISAEDGLPVRFPYFFFDFDRIGALSFAFIGGLMIFLLIIGHVFYFVDKRRKPG